MRLDLGCGKNKIKEEGKEWIGVDVIPFEGVDAVIDLRRTPWVVAKEADLLNKDAPFFATNNGDEVGEAHIILDGSVDEIHCSHFLEHLTGEQRIKFFNEMFRVLKPGGQARIITPHWSHERAYGDPTHQWPPVCSWTYFYINKAWREVNAPHVGYECDFDYVLSGTHDPNDAWVAFRNIETKTILMTRNINTATDLIATLIKR